MATAWTVNRVISFLLIYKHWLTYSRAKGLRPLFKIPRIASVINAILFLELEWKGEYFKMDWNICKTYWNTKEDQKALTVMDFPVPDHKPIAHL